MSIAIIYDENILDSFMAAASVASVVDCHVYERKDRPKTYCDTYLWIGVVPTNHYFYVDDLEIMKSKTNVSIVGDIASDTHFDILDNLIFMRNSESELEFVTNYGQKTLVEKALAFFDISPAKFCGVVDMVRNFYKKDLSIESIENSVLNAEEALHCLKNKEPYSYIEFNPESCDTASEVYQRNIKEAGRAISYRSSVVNIKSDNKTDFVYTLYEHRLLWLIKRRFITTNRNFRNISVSGTGTVILGNVHIRKEFDHLKPVFLFQ